MNELGLFFCICQVFMTSVHMHVQVFGIFLSFESALEAVWHQFSSFGAIEIYLFWVYLNSLFQEDNQCFCDVGENASKGS